MRDMGSIAMQDPQVNDFHVVDELQWKQISSDRWERPLDDLESFFGMIHSAGAQIGQQHWAVSNDFLLCIYCFGYSRRVAMRLVASMSKTYPLILETFLKRELLMRKIFS